MKAYTLRLPDEIAKRVQAYAQARQEPPEEALVRLIEARFASPQLPSPNAKEGTQEATKSDMPPSLPTIESAEYPDPWAGFRDRFTADVPDLFTHHDAYLAEAALDPHEPHEIEITEAFSSDHHFT